MTTQKQITPQIALMLTIDGIMTTPGEFGDKLTSIMIAIGMFDLIFPEHTVKQLFDEMYNTTLENLKTDPEYKKFLTDRPESE